jgi:hypothetical protein
VSLCDFVDLGASLVLVGLMAWVVALAIIWTPIGIIYAGRSLWRRFR